MTDVIIHGDLIEDSKPNTIIVVFKSKTGVEVVGVVCDSLDRAIKRVVKEEGIEKEAVLLAIQNTALGPVALKLSEGYLSYQVENFKVLDASGVVKNIPTPDKFN